MSLKHLDMKEKMHKIAENIYELPKQKGMNVPGRIFASDELFKSVEEQCVVQLSNIAKLPGIVGNAMAMSDVHVGYGAPVGGVAAFDAKKGIVSPGVIGYDINCGVRLLITDIDKKQFLTKRNKILKEIYVAVPSGVGKKSKFNLNNKEIDRVLELGVDWAIEKGYGNSSDKELCESNGVIANASSIKVSQKARGRGMNQLGTLGAGNHFMEIQCVEEIYDKNAAKTMGINNVGQIAIMIHSGSRGVGHQVASDYLKKMEEEYGIKHLPDRELAYASIDSELGKDYLSAMAGAANFGFANRHLIMHQIREVFKNNFSKSKIELVYDLAHNIAKFEEHVVDNKKMKVLVHRKGATRSFGPGNKDIPLKYKKIGCPIFIPGSMGTFSYVLTGTSKAEGLTFGSAAHGAGRIMSRSEASKKITAEKLGKELKDKDVVLESGSLGGTVDEAPEAYKDVDEVVRVSNELGIGKMVAKLKPLGVVKG